MLGLACPKYFDTDITSLPVTRQVEAEKAESESEAKEWKMSLSCV